MVATLDLPLELKKFQELMSESENQEKILQIYRQLGAINPVLIENGGFFMAHGHNDETDAFELLNNRFHVEDSGKVSFASKQISGLPLAWKFDNAHVPFGISLSQNQNLPGDLKKFQYLMSQIKIREQVHEILTKIGEINPLLLKHGEFTMLHAYNSENGDIEMLGHRFQHENTLTLDYSDTVGKGTIVGWRFNKLSIEASSGCTYSVCSGSNKGKHSTEDFEHETDCPKE